jgi:hypothetical protein
MCRPPLGPTQPSIQEVQVAPALGVERLEREANHIQPSDAEVEKARTVPPGPQTPS